MSEKKNSAVQRVFKSIVAPALGTSMALFVGCSTSTPQPSPEKTSTENQPATKSSIYVGKIVPPGEPTPVTAPATAPTSEPVAPTPIIPKPGEIVAPKPPPVKVGTVVAPKKPTPPKVGTVTAPPYDRIEDVGTTKSHKKASQERPSRMTRRTTDQEGGLFRTGFVGGRKLH